MKVLKADISVPDAYIELEFDDDQELSKKDIENMLFDELIEELPALKIYFEYGIEEK